MNFSKLCFVNMSKDLWSQVKTRHKTLQKITTEFMQVLPGQRRLILYNFTKLNSLNLFKKWSFGVRMTKMLPFCQPDYHNSLQYKSIHRYKSVSGLDKLCTRWRARTQSACKEVFVCINLHAHKLIKALLSSTWMLFKVVGCFCVWKQMTLLLNQLRAA